MSSDLEQAFFRVVDESVEWILRCTDGLDRRGLDWAPADGANCLYAIAVHTMANAERNILSSYCGQPYDYDREAEFAARAGGDAGSLRAAWAGLRPRLLAGLATTGPDALNRDCDHVRMGRVKGWEVLVQVSRHASEHVGEARLTRQLLDDRETNLGAPAG